MDSNILDMSSTDSDENIRINKRIRRNKSFLYKNYDPNMVSKQTKRKYDVLCTSTTEESGSKNVKLDATIDYKTDEEDKSNDQESQCNEESEQLNDIYNRQSDNINIINDFSNGSSIENNPDENIFESEFSESEKSWSVSDISINEDDSDNDINNENSGEKTNDYSIFDKIMFKTSELTIRDVILMCTAFALRFHLADEALLILVSMFQMCAGADFDNINISKYMMSKCFSSQNEHITYHYYCNNCSNKIIYSVKATEKVKEYLANCESCNNQVKIISATEDYFVTIDLKYQLQILLSNTNILTDILKNIELMKNFSKNELFKGSAYKNIIEYNKKNNHILLTLNCNTDGAPLTKSGKKGFWPIQLCLNELSDRLKYQFLFLTGLLMVDKEPKSNLMNMYLSKFSDQIIYLFANGIELVHEGLPYFFKFCTFSFPVDSVCRPILQNRIQFNGYSGCSWCYQIGKYLKTIHGIRYVRDQVSNLRNHESHMQHVKESQGNCSIKGVKGSSSLSDLPFIDMVWSFSYEYMHGLLLGVVLQLKNLWKNKSCQFCISNNDLILLEKQFLKITPTQEIHRLPRKGIIAGNTKPKASELKSWLLYYSLPLLKNILHNKALEHYMLLVKSAFILLKPEITESELTQCEENLIEFVCTFEDLYGPEAMTFNVHTLMHCVQSVTKTGPLYDTSAFPYESSIYTLKQYVTGPKGRDRQMARKHLQSFIFKTNVQNSIGNTSTRIVTFCSNLFSSKRLLNYYSQTEDVTLCGKAVLVNNENGSFFAYKKCIYLGAVYHTSDYVHDKKTDNSVVETVSGDFCRIIQILYRDNICKLKLLLMKMCSKNPFPGVLHIKQVEEEDNSKTILIAIKDIKRKVIIVKVHSTSYLCLMPNTNEVQ